MVKISKILYNAIEYSNENPQLSISKVAELFKVDRHSITKHKEDYIKYNYFYNDNYYYLTEEELKPVKYYLEHQNETIMAIAKKFNTKTDTIKRRLLVIGQQYQKRYQRKFNRKAFMKINTEEDAYWLGFILADGYLNEDRGFLKIKLGIQDEQHLYKFALYMEDDEPKKHIKYENGGAYTKDNKCCSIEFDSREVSNNLIALGIRQNKSGKEQPINFDNKDLTKAYIRGMIDGDGHIKDGYFKYVGSLESCQYVKDFFQEFITYNNNCKYIYEHGKIYSFELRNKKVNEVFKYIYNKSNIYLERKYQIVQNL